MRRWKGQRERRLRDISINGQPGKIHQTSSAPVLCISTDCYVIHAAWVILFPRGNDMRRRRLQGISSTNLIVNVVLKPTFNINFYRPQLSSQSRIAPQAGPESRKAQGRKLLGMCHVTGVNENFLGLPHSLISCSYKLPWIPNHFSLFSSFTLNP